MKKISGFSQSLSTFLSLSLILTAPGVSWADASLTSPVRQSVLDVPQGLGVITGSFVDAPTQKPRVVLIQDLHLHAETQQHIQRLLEYLERTLHSDGLTVGIEGASGEVRSQRLGALPNRAAKQKIANYLIRNGELTGAEAYAIVNGRTQSLHGLEERASYNAHLALFRRSYENRVALANQLDTLSGSLEVLKQTRWPAALRKIDRLRQRFVDGKLPLDGYLNAILASAPNNQWEEHFPSIAAYQCATTRVQTVPSFLSKDLRDLSASLIPALSLSEKRQLASLKETPLDYGTLLWKFAKAHHADTLVSENLRAFLNQLETGSDERLLPEAEALSFHLEAALAPTALARRMAVADQAIFVLKRIAKEQVSEEEIRAYAPVVDQWVNALSALSHQVHLPLDSASFSRAAQAAVDFYVMALARNQSLAENTLSLLANSKNDPVVVVTGGFHTQGVAQILKGRGIPYVVITPTVRTIPSSYERLYLERLLGRHLTPRQLAVGLRGIFLAAPIDENLPALRFAFTWGGRLAVKPSSLAKAWSILRPWLLGSLGVGIVLTVFHWVVQPGASAVHLLPFSSVFGILAAPHQSRPTDELDLAQTSLPLRFGTLADVAKDIWRAIRGESRVVATGAVTFSETFPQVEQSGPTDLQATQAVFENGLRDLHALSGMPSVMLLLAGFQEQSIPIRWVRGTGRVGRIDLSGDIPVIELHADLAEKLRLTKDDPSPGARALAMLQWVYLLGRASGEDHRQAAHHVLDVYEVLKHSQPDVVLALRALLAPIDSEHLFTLLLEAGAEEEPVALRAAESLALLETLQTVPLPALPRIPFFSVEELRNALYLASKTLDETSDSSRAGDLLRPFLSEPEWVPFYPFFSDIIQNIATKDGKERLKALQRLLDERYRWRDNAIVTASGQSIIDLPWSRQGIRTLFSQAFANEDDRRKAIGDSISGADRRSESENLRRLAAIARERGIPFFVVRMGRAAHNQGLYAAASRIVEVSPEMRQAAQNLEKQIDTAGHADLLGPSARELLALVYHGQPIPNPHYEGRIKKLRDNVNLARTKALERLHQDRAERILPQNERLRRKRRQELDDLRKQLSIQFENLEGAIDALEEAFEQAPRIPNAIVVYSFRGTPTGGPLGATIMDGGDPYPGKEESLKDLKLDGGIYTFATTSLEAFRYATDVLEAPPLFISEETKVVGDKEIKVVDISQQELEILLRSVSPEIATNIQQSLFGDFISLAREQIVQNRPELRERFNEALQTLEQNGTQRSFFVEDGLRRDILRDAKLGTEVGRLASVFAEAYRGQAMDVKKYLEAHEQDAPSFMDALRAVLTNPDATQGMPALDPSRLDHWLKELTPSLDLRNRALPDLDEFINYMMMTTMGPGLTEAFLHRMLNEEITLENIIREHGWQDRVNERKKSYQEKLTLLGRKIIKEVGKEPELRAKEASGMSEARAVESMLGTYKTIRDRVTALAVLHEWDEKMEDMPLSSKVSNEPLSVQNLLEALFGEEALAVESQDLAGLSEVLYADDKSGLVSSAVKATLDRNLPPVDVAKLTDHRAALAAIHADTRLLQDFGAELLARSRELALDRLNEAVKSTNSADPSVKIITPRDLQKRYLLDHTRLATTTAKREIIQENNAIAEAGDPYFVYDFYNLSHTSSRVNLGQGEDDSVSVWTQWGGTRHKRSIARVERILRSMNQNVVVVHGMEKDEMFKMGDNAGRNIHFSTSNAFALVIEAIRSGDIEDLIQQMNERGEDLLPPPGSGYGGYCIPKDLFYLKLALALDNEMLLRKIGVPDSLHAPLIAFAKRIYGERYRFEYEAEWVEYADRELAADPAMRNVFKAGPLMIQTSDIGRSLAEQGQLQLYDNADFLMRNLVGNFGTDKIIVNSEEFLRFLVFFSSWQWLRQISPELDKKVISMMINYKGSTVDDLSEDIRYSVAIRMFEILMGEYDHLTHSLDAHGRLLAQLMVEGFDPDLKDPKDATRPHPMIQATWDLLGLEPTEENKKRLHDLFPRLGIPADIKIYSPLHAVTQTGATVEDIYRYYTGNAIEANGQEVLRALAQLGLRREGIEANMKSFGGDLERWHVGDVKPQAWEAFKESHRGTIHAAVLEVRGIERNLERAFTGIDTAHLSAPYPALWDLLHYPSKLVFLMRRSRPQSDLHLFDAPAGRRVRAMGRFDVMRWMAHGGTYQSIGIGEKTLQEWHDQMNTDRHRVMHWVHLLDEGRFAEAEAYYNQLRRWSGILHKQANDELKKLQTLKMTDRRLRARIPDAVAKTLFHFHSGRLPMDSLSGSKLKAVVAALGGMYQLDGEPEEEIDAFFQRLERSLLAYRQSKNVLVAPSEGLTEDDARTLYGTLVQPQYIPPIERPEVAKREVSSVKASDDEGTLQDGLGSRLEDEERAREEALREARRKGHTEGWDFPAQTLPDLIHQTNQTRNTLLGLLQNSSQPDGMDLARLQGRFLALTQRAALIGTTQVLGNRFRQNPEAMNELSDAVKALDDGQGALSKEGWEHFFGEELQSGVLSRLLDDYLDVSGRVLKRFMPVLDLLETNFALEETLSFAAKNPTDVSPTDYDKARARFMGATVNDHFHDHLPWFFHRSRAIKTFFDPPQKVRWMKRLAQKISEIYDTIFSISGRNKAFDWAADMHAWLYDYFQLMDRRYSPLKDVSQKQYELLAGTYRDGDGEVALTAQSRNKSYRRWLAYLQQASPLRLQATGFPVQDAFESFDPDIIQASKRVNLFYAFVPERPHVQGFIEEGPAVNTQLEQNGEPGMNLLIGRDGHWVRQDYAGHPARKKLAFGVTEAYVSLTREQYIQALRNRDPKLTLADAEAQATAKLKGKTKPYIYVAVRFQKDGQEAPVATVPIAMHGHWRFVQGEFEDNGISAWHGSRAQIVDSYDKWLTATSMEGRITQPEQIVWKQTYNTTLHDHFTARGMTEPEIAQAIEKVIIEGRKADGYEVLAEKFFQNGGEKPYVGAREFVEKYQQVVLPTAQPGGRVLTKPSAGSGSRGMEIFNAMTHHADGTSEVDEDVLKEISEALYELGWVDNILLATIWSLQPEFFMSETYMQWFEKHQVQKGQSLQRDIDTIYTTYRLILSTDDPQDPDAYDFHHPIVTSASTSGRKAGLITNEASGGQFAVQLWKFISLGEWPAFMRAMRQGTRAVAMGTERAVQSAMSDLDVSLGYALTGESYGQPWWKMVDLWVMPKLSVAGRLAYTEPILDSDGQRVGTRVWIAKRNKETGKEELVEAKIEGHDPVLIEKNDGIGQVVQVRRFEEQERKALPDDVRTEQGHWPVGANDRIPIMNFARAMRRYYAILFGEAYLGSANAVSRLAKDPAQNALATQAIQSTRQALASFEPSKTTTPLTPDDLSVVLTQYVLHALETLGTTPEEAQRALRPSTKEDFPKRAALLERMDSLLTDLGEELNQAGHWTEPVSVDSWLQNGDNVRTLYRLVLEHLDKPRAGLPELKVLGRKISEEELRQCVGERPLHAMVYNTPVGMATELYQWVLEAERSQAQTPSYAVILLEARDVTERGQARRITFWDPQTKEWIQAMVEQPFWPERVQVMALNASDERAVHEGLSRKFAYGAPEGLELLNSSESSQKVDSKFQATDVLRRAGLLVPESRLVEATQITAVRDERFEHAVLSLARTLWTQGTGRRQIPLMIQPDHGTAGTDVKRFVLMFEQQEDGRITLIKDAAFENAIEHVQKIGALTKDDVLIRESWEGDTDIRLYAFRGGEASTVLGYGQVTADGSINASLSEGGRQVSIEDALTRVGANGSQGDLRKLAERVANAVDLRTVSMDVRWKRVVSEEGNVRLVPGVLDIHSRIEGLHRSRPLTAEDRKPMPFFAASALDSSGSWTHRWARSTSSMLSGFAFIHPLSSDHANIAKVILAVLLAALFYWMVMRITAPYRSRQQQARLLQSALESDDFVATPNSNLGEDLNQVGLSRQISLALQILKHQLQRPNYSWAITRSA